MIKVTDYIATVLKQKGITTVFGVTGGAVVHLFDSAQKMGLECIFTHHEQSAAFAAGAFSRIKGLGTLFCTTGPGGTNTLTGIAAAWLDSVPLICIGGQVRLSHIKPPKVRQVGAQELDIVSLMKPITKLALTLENIDDLPETLERCIEIAKRGRPGPIYLEIPLDLQWQTSSFDLPFLKKEPVKFPLDQEKIKEICDGLNKAKKPLLLIGHGVRLAEGEELLKSFLQKTKMPHVATWNAIDIVSGESSLYLGSPGMFGTREANLAVQACDFLLCLGAHLPIAVTTGLVDKFANKARVALVNIDLAEIENQRIKIDYGLQADVTLFLKEILSLVAPLNIFSWQQACSKIRRLFLSSQKPLIQKSLGEEVIDPYESIRIINRFLGEEGVVVVDGGGTVVQIALQTLFAKAKQRILIDAGLCSMGSGLPQVLGACMARPKAEVVCLVGDGSFMFNVQELQTIFEHKMNVSIFVFNNGGYLSIRNTQKGFLEGNYLGSSEEGGISVAKIEALAKAFCLPYFRVNKEKELQELLFSNQEKKGPKVYELVISKEQEVYPRIGFSKNKEGRAFQNPIDKMDPPIFEEESALFLTEFF